MARRIRRDPPILSLARKGGMIIACARKSLRPYTHLPMKKNISLLLLAAAGILWLAGCNKEDAATAKARTVEAGNAMKDAAGTAVEKTKEAMDKAGEVTKDAAGRAKDKAMELGDQAKDKAIELGDKAKVAAGEAVEKAKILATDAAVQAKDAAVQIKDKAVDAVKNLPKQ